MTPQQSVATTDLGSDLVVYAARLIRSIRREHDLPAGIRVLALLDELGPLGVTALAQADGCSQPTMSAAVAIMDEAGWVTKLANPADARGCVVHLTDLGAQTLADLRATYGRTVSERLAGRSEDDIRIAVEVLRDLLNDGSDRGAL